MPRAPTGRDFYVATSEEIRDGRTTDVYFLRTLDILKKAGKDRTRVVAEVTAGTLPNGWPWGILCGVEEAVHLLKGRPVSLWSLPEGSLFPARTARGISVPVMILEGAYGDWAVYETPVLGLICQASGIATKASRLRKLAAGKQLLSFGVRRMHPDRAVDRAVRLRGRGRRDYDAPRRRAVRRARDGDDAPRPRNRHGRAEQLGAEGRRNRVG